MIYGLIRTYSSSRVGKTTLIKFFLIAEKKISGLIISNLLSKLV